MLRWTDVNTTFCINNAALNSGHDVNTTFCKNNAALNLGHDMNTTFCINNTALNSGHDVNTTFCKNNAALNSGHDVNTAFCINNAALNSWHDVNTTFCINNVALNSGNDVSTTCCKNNAALNSWHDVNTTFCINYTLKNGLIFNAVWFSGFTCNNHGEWTRCWIQRWIDSGTRHHWGTDFKLRPTLRLTLDFQNLLRVIYSYWSNPCSNSGRLVQISFNGLVIRANDGWIFFICNI